MAHDNFVSTDWLAEHLDEPGLGVIDASWHLPPTGRVGASEFRACCRSRRRSAAP